MKGVDVRTHAYVTIHKKQPHGFGRWVFKSSIVEDTPLIFQTGGSYDKAKRQAALWARKNGLKEVVLCP